MRLDDDFDDYDDFDNDIENYSDKNKSIIGYGIASVFVVLAILFVVVIASNSNDRASNSSIASKTIQNAEAENLAQMESERSVNELLTGSTLTAQDLDFWDDYPNENNYKKNDAVSIDKALEEEEEEEEEDPSTDGMHTLITYSDGKEEWVDINPYVKKNDYNYNNLVFKNSIMKYYESNHLMSFVGVDLSKTDDFVDFNELKKAGVDYVMLRLGQRGYNSGELTLDEKFLDYYEAANEAGLDVGIYFYSQAINKEEAVMEAEFVVDTISMNSVSQDGVIDKIKYPIVFYMENIAGDDARTDELTQMQRTNIAIAFMDFIEDNGYTPMLYGNKEWLIKKYSIGSLEGYDIWLDEAVDVPSYPYRYQMWRYTRNGTIKGISGDASLSISFVDYAIQ